METRILNSNFNNAEAMNPVDFRNAIQSAIDRAKTNVKESKLDLSVELLLLSGLTINILQSLKENRISQSKFEKLLLGNADLLLSAARKSVKTFFMEEVKSNNLHQYLQLIQDYLRLERSLPKFDTVLEEVSNTIQYVQPEILLEWKKVSYQLLNAHKLTIFVLDLIFTSIKTDNRFDIEKLRKLIVSLGKDQIWCVVKLLLDLHGKDFPVDMILEKHPLIVHTSWSLDKMSNILSKYLLLLGATKSVDGTCIESHTSIGKNLQSLKQHLANIYDAIFNPLTAVPFFTNLPKDLKHEIALKTLRENDGYLKEIPDKVLLNNLYNKEMRAYENHITDEEKITNKNKAFKLAIRFYRKLFNLPINKDVTLDIRDTFKEISSKKFNDIPFHKANRFCFYEILKRKALVEKAYLNEPTVEESFAELKSNLKTISTIVDQICEQYYKESRKSVNALERDDLIEKLTLAIAKNANMKEWDATSIQMCVGAMVTLLKQKSYQPASKPTVDFFQKSELACLITAEEVENTVLEMLDQSRDSMQMTM